MTIKEFLENKENIAIHCDTEEKELFEKLIHTYGEKQLIMGFAK